MPRRNAYIHSQYNGKWNAPPPRKWYCRLQSTLSIRKALQEACRGISEKVWNETSFGWRRRWPNICEVAGRRVGKTRKAWSSDDWIRRKDIHRREGASEWAQGRRSIWQKSIFILIKMITQLNDVNWWICVSMSMPSLNSKFRISLYLFSRWSSFTSLSELAFKLSLSFFKYPQVKLICSSRVKSIFSFPPIYLNFSMYFSKG